jgi:hypothetical protein
MSDTINTIRRRAFCWRTWLHGLIGASVAAGANSVAVVMIDPKTFNLNEGLGNLAKLALVTGIVGAAQYLRKSPVPDLEPEN